MAGRTEGRARGRASCQGRADGLCLMSPQVTVGGGDDTHALAPLRAAHSPGLLSWPVGGLVGRVEEGGRGAQDFLLCPGPPLLLEVLDALGHGHVGVGCAVQLVQEVVQLVLVEALDQIEDVLDRRAGSDAGLCLWRHFRCGSSLCTGCAWPLCLYTVIFCCILLDFIL